MTDPLPLERAEPGQIEAPWRELARASGNVFGTPEFLLLWRDHFAAGKPLELLASRSHSGELIALWPLYVWRRWPVRVVRPLGHDAGDELGPVCLPADRGRAGAALAAARRSELLIAQQLPADDALLDSLGGRLVSTEPSPTLALAFDSWDDMLASRSKNLREQVRRRERKLARDHGLHFRLGTAETLEDDLDVLFDLHRARWGAASAFGRREAFHRDFAREAQRQGWLRLWFLEADGRAVAAWQGFRYDGRESFYQAGRDSAWEAHSVGLVLLAHTIREALGDGMREYRFLRGGEPYKFRFADDDPGLASVAVARGVVGGEVLTAAVRYAARRASARSAA